MNEKPTDYKEVFHYCTILAGAVLVLCYCFSRLETEVSLTTSDSNFVTLPETSTKKEGPFILAGRHELQTHFRDLIDIIQNPAKYAPFHVTWPGNVVLEGPPGCGKTYAVRALADYLGIPIYEINASTIGSTYIHESAMTIANIFNKAASTAPSIIIVDEMDTYLQKRQDEYPMRVEETTEFLRHLQYTKQNKVLVFGMTNRLETVDPAILRKGRFDQIIHVAKPKEAELTEIVSYELQKYPFDKDLDTSFLPELLKKHSMADVAYIFHEAALQAARKGKKAIDQDALQQALEKLFAPEIKAYKKKKEAEKVEL